MTEENAWYEANKHLFAAPPSPWDRLLALANEYKIPLLIYDRKSTSRDDTNDKRFVWDGHDLFLDEYDDTINSCHEVAHYIVAQPWQRAIPDYGLGRGPTSFRGQDSYIRAKAEELYILKDNHFVELQEEAANLLTYFIAAHIQLSPEYWIDDAETNGWRWHIRKRGYNMPVEPVVLLSSLVEVPSVLPGHRPTTVHTRWTYDLSGQNLYDQQEMQSFFSAYKRLEHLGVIRNQVLTMKLNSHTRSPFKDDYP